MGGRGPCEHGDKPGYIYKYTMTYQSNTTKLYYVYYCIRVTCFNSYIESSSGPSENTDTYLAMFKILNIAK